MVATLASRLVGVVSIRRGRRGATQHLRLVDDLEIYRLVDGPLHFTLIRDMILLHHILINWHLLDVKILISIEEALSCAELTVLSVGDQEGHVVVLDVVQEGEDHLELS